jgi:trans-aconitate methyltransferase
MFRKPAKASNHPNPQLWPFEKFRRYSSPGGAHVLEIGGNEKCLSAKPFVEAGAARVVVSGLRHVSNQAEVKGVELCSLDAFDVSQRFGKESFDFIYGVSVLEHIPETSNLLQQLLDALKPGGYLYLQGAPVWSSAKGHHIWLTTWKDGTTANYLFNNYPGMESVNPIPHWGHLLMDKAEMADFLESENIPPTDIESIVRYVYETPNINRLTFTDIQSAANSSSFVVQELHSQFPIALPEDTRAKLIDRYGSREVFDFGGLEFMLQKPAGTSLVGKLRSRFFQWL